MWIQSRENKFLLLNYFVQIGIIDVYPWWVGLEAFMITITVVGDSNQLCIVLDDGHGDMAHSIFNISMLSKGGPIVQPKDHPKTHFSFSWIKSFNCHQKDMFALNTVVTLFIEIDHNWWHAYTPKEELLTCTRFKIPKDILGEAPQQDKSPPLVGETVPEVPAQCSIRCLTTLGIYLSSEHPRFLGQEKESCFLI